MNKPADVTFADALRLLTASKNIQSELAKSKNNITYFKNYPLQWKVIRGMFCA